MQVFHTAGVPPSNGRAILANSGWIRNNRAEPTNSVSAKKTGKGKLRARHAFTSHNLGKKDRKRKRRLGRPVEVTRQDRKRVRDLMGS